MNISGVKNRRAMVCVYAILWVLVGAAVFVDSARTHGCTSLSSIDWSVVGDSLVRLLPYLMLFLVNSLVLMPKLLFKSRYVKYWLLCAVTIGAAWTFQYGVFSLRYPDHNEKHKHHERRELIAPRQSDAEPAAVSGERPERPLPPREGGPDRGKGPEIGKGPGLGFGPGPEGKHSHGGKHGRGPKHHPLMPLPLMLSLIYDILIFGVNLVVALIFQRMEALDEKRRLQKANADAQLAYLNLQINPHFYMNMLNNIHGMIDIDAEKAQEMVISMSRLMRYMLYDCSQPQVELLAEVAFLRDYLELMRQRYPQDKVKITAELPSESDIAGVRVAPLLFIVFIENAFKHGITYREESFVSVKMTLENGRLEFVCANSNHTIMLPGGPHGIGLNNVESRLKLIYGDSYTLEAGGDGRQFKVKLTIPINETSHSNH